MNSIISRFAALVALCFLSGPALATVSVVGTITFAKSVATPVPTLSGIMLVMMALLLAAVGYRILKQRDNNASRMMVISLIAVGALMSGAGGVKLINDAYAGGVLVDIDAPGSYNVTTTDNIYTNTSSSDLTVSDIDVDLDLVSCDGTCVVNSVIAPAASCNLYCPWLPPA